MVTSSCLCVSKNVTIFLMDSFLTVTKSGFFLPSLSLRLISLFLRLFKDVTLAFPELKSNVFLLLSKIYKVSLSVFVAYHTLPSESATGAVILVIGLCEIQPGTIISPSSVNTYGILYSTPGAN